MLDIEVSAEILSLVVGFGNDDLCEGLVPTPSVGVFLQSSKARNSDWPVSWHLVNKRFTVLTAFSAFPLDCGYLGEDVVCSNPHFLVKAANSDDENCGPLSVTRTSGTPYRANIAFSALVTSVVLTLLTFSTSMKLL